MKEEGKLSTCHVNFAFAVAALALAAAIALIVMLGVYDYVGFTGTIPISLSTCTSNYFSLKYGSFLTNMVEATFVISLFAVLIASILFIILLMWVVAICKGSLPNESISLNSKIILYILSSLLVLSAIIPFGYHLSYAIELNNCTGSSNSNQLIGLLIVALALFILALLLWILLIVAYCRNQDAEQKYRDVYTNTDKEKTPYQPRKYVQPQQQQQQQQQQHLEHVEYTKENLMESPKRPTQNYYLKESQPQQPMPEYQSRPYSKYESPKSRTPPYLEPKKTTEQKPSSIGYISSNKYLVPPNEGELVFSRSRKDPIRQDEDALHKEEKKYLGKYGGSILPSSGVEEKESRQNRMGSDYYRSGEPSRQYPEKSPPKQAKREGVLINYIRGKYANN